MQCEHYLGIIRYCQPNKQRLIKNAYEILLIDSHNGKSNWVSQVEQLLEMTGFDHVRIYQLGDI